MDVSGNRITGEEFELSWATGQYRVRDYHEFKCMVLVNAREQGYLQEVFFEANAWYPNRPLSECIAMSERAIKELVAEGLIQLGLEVFNNLGRRQRIP